MNNTYNNTSKKNMVIIFGGILLVIAVIILLFINKLKNDDNSLNNNVSNNTSNHVYYDSNRNLKEKYTFDEAISKFAFVVGDETLIFKGNNKVSLVTLPSVFNKEYALSNIFFFYDDSTEKVSSGGSIGTIKFNVSNASSLEEFAANFKKGIVDNGPQKNYLKNIKIIESNDQYVVGSWEDDVIEDSPYYEYYYGIKIGDKIYYICRSSSVNESADFDILLKEFKSLASCLSEDDKQEAYIYDKVINVPIILNKKITSYDKIVSISSTNNYSSSGIINLEFGNKNYLSVEFDAIDHFNDIKWSKEIGSNAKYSESYKGKIIGISDGNDAQIFTLSNYEGNINSTNELFNAIKNAIK